LEATTRLKQLQLGDVRTTLEEAMASRDVAAIQDAMEACRKHSDMLDIVNEAKELIKQLLALDSLAQAVEKRDISALKVGGACCGCGCGCESES
jgi:hypothetical protein